LATPFEFMEIFGVGKLDSLHCCVALFM